MGDEPAFTRELAAFVERLTYEHLPPEVVAKAKGTLLDYIGAALAGSRRDHCQEAVELVSSFGGVSEATVLGEQLRTAAPWAAYLNGLFGSSTPQQDDVWKESLGHPGVGTHPSVLALGERVGVRGRETIVAIVAGYELAMRIGAAAGKAALDRGWHPRGGVNYFAAAGAGAKVLGLSGTDAYCSALGLAGNTAAGLTGASYFHDAWYTLSANASLNGVLAALLAAAGYTAGESILEAEYGGYLRVIVDRADWPRMMRGLGTEFEIMNIGQKIHASSGATHAAVDAALQIVTEQDLSAQDVTKVGVRGFASMVGRTGRPHPRNLVHAGMSVPFLVAAAIVFRRVGLREVRAEAWTDPRVEALQGIMELSVDPSLESLAPRYLGASVEITTRQGRTFSATVTVPKGDPENPLSSQEIEAKFSDLAAPVIGGARVEEVVAVVRELETLDDIRDLTALLAPAG